MGFNIHNILVIKQTQLSCKYGQSLPTLKTDLNYVTVYF